MLTKIVSFYIYIYIYICVCVCLCVYICVCVCMWKREREWERESVYICVCFCEFLCAWCHLDLIFTKDLIGFKNHTHRCTNTHTHTHIDAQIYTRSHTHYAKEGCDRCSVFERSLTGLNSVFFPSPKLVALPSLKGPPCLSIHPDLVGEL